MEKLSYEQLLAPYPIKLSMATLRKPKLHELYDISFSTFYLYQFLMEMTPEQYFIELRKEQEGAKYWDSLSGDEQKAITLTYLIAADDSLRDLFISMLNFFVVEEVIQYKGILLILGNSIDIETAQIEEVQENVKTILDNESLLQLLAYIRQTCYMQEKKKEEEPVFKNDIAKRMWEKMKKAEKIETAHKNEDFTLPNIISKVSNYHSSISPLNIW